MAPMRAADFATDCAYASAAPIFVGGWPRPGTTLLRAVLDPHPSIACGLDAGVIGRFLAARKFQAELGALRENVFTPPPERVRTNFAAAVASILASRAVAAISRPRRSPNSCRAPGPNAPRSAISDHCSRSAFDSTLEIGLRR
jgi:hypothetical protein